MQNTMADEKANNESEARQMPGNAVMPNSKTSVDVPSEEKKSSKPMSGIKVNEDFLKEIVGFNNSAKPLGERDDLHLLAEMALTVNPSLQRFFEELPTLEKIEAHKTKSFIEKTK